MGEVVHYVLGDIFRFISAVILIALFFDGLTSVVVAIRGGQPNSVLSRAFGGSRDDATTARDRETRSERAPNADQG